MRRNPPPLHLVNQEVRQQLANLVRLGRRLLEGGIFVFEVEERVAKRRGIAKVGAGVFFNATYEPIGRETITDWEGCLSVPFLGGEVPRYKKLRVRGLDHEGNPSAIEVEDFTARIFQHEIDHTDGRVYLDRMPDLTTLGYTIIL